MVILRGVVLNNSSCFKAMIKLEGEHGKYTMDWTRKTNVMIERIKLEMKTEEQRDKNMV